MTNSVKLMSWNVKGLNSPQKRKHIYHYLGKMRSDVICLQETHTKKSEIKYLKNPKLGTEFVSAGEKRKKGVVLYINKNMNAKQVFNDPKGRYIGVELEWHLGKTLIVGLYAPIENKEKFYKEITNLLIQYDYANTILMGDWNGVIDPEQDRKSEKTIKKNQGKLPRSFFEMKDLTAVMDIWRVKYGDIKDYTYYSESHKSWSRIDMFMVTSAIAPRVDKVDILPKTLSDHSPITMEVRFGNKEFN